MEELKRHFITSDREYREGEVFVYEQKFTVKDVKKAVFTATALGVYEAEINGVKIGNRCLHRDTPTIRGVCFTRHMR